MKKPIRLKELIACSDYDRYILITYNFDGGIEGIDYQQGMDDPDDTLGIDFDLTRFYWEAVQYSPISSMEFYSQINLIIDLHFHALNK